MSAHPKRENERELFEKWIVREAGPGATKRWLNTSSYENLRVNDYRTGWVACLDMLDAYDATDRSAVHTDCASVPK